mgnify:CR=1 FL=1
MGAFARRFSTLHGCVFKCVCLCVRACVGASMPTHMHCVFVSAHARGRMPACVRATALDPCPCIAERERAAAAPPPPPLRAHLGDSDALEWVYQQHARYQVARAGAEVRGQVVDAALDLLEKVWDVLVVKGQAAAEQRVQDHAARPHVDLGARVQLAADDLAGQGAGVRLRTRVYVCSSARATWRVSQLTTTEARGARARRRVHGSTGGMHRKRAACSSALRCARRPTHLWRRVVGAAAGGLEEVAVVHHVAEPKVCDLDRHAAVKQ